MEDRTKVVFDVIYLLNCSLHGKTNDKQRVEGMDIEAIKKICRESRISALMSLCLNEYDDSGYWKKAKNNAIRKTVLYEAERKKLYEFLNKEGIWFLPLKGIVISKYYPEYGIREFSDNDILFDKTYQKKVRDYFAENGYTVTAYNKSNHDKYEKKPVFKFEMHTNLFSDIAGPKVRDYFNSIYDKTIKQGDSCELSLNDSDLYVYVMAHAIKHYNESGTGLRTLTDTYLLIKNLKIDWQYADHEFQTMGILKEADELKDLSLTLFGNDEISLTDQQVSTLSKIIDMGVYGTQENRIENRLSRLGKTGFIRDRLFVPVEKLKTRHPLVYKYRILLPGFYAWRIIKGITVKGKKTVKELMYVLRHK